MRFSQPERLNRRCSKRSALPVQPRSGKLQLPQYQHTQRTLANYTTEVATVRKQLFPNATDSMPCSGNCFFLAHALLLPATAALPGSAHLLACCLPPAPAPAWRRTSEHGCGSEQPSWCQYALRESVTRKRASVRAQSSERWRAGPTPPPCLKAQPARGHHKARPRKAVTCTQRRTTNTRARSQPILVGHVIDVQTRALSVYVGCSNATAEAKCKWVAPKAPPGYQKGMRTRKATA